MAVSRHYTLFQSLLFHGQNRKISSTKMLKFDQLVLPQVPSRKALIVVDYQNAFLQSTGRFAVSDADDLINRTIALTTAFRSVGQIIWLQSKYEATRSGEGSGIIEGKTPPSSRDKAQGIAGDTQEDNAPEAFLCSDSADLFKPGSESYEIPDKIKEIKRDTDWTLIKTHYSGFRETSLLHMLRSKMIMDVAICGSLANVGVYATALDAAGHGLKLTVVGDCCGFRHKFNQLRAFDSLANVIGCEFTSSDELIGNGTPDNKRHSQKEAELENNDIQGIPPELVDLILPMKNLGLNNNIPISPNTSKTPRAERRVGAGPEAEKEQDGSSSLSSNIRETNGNSQPSDNKAARPHVPEKVRQNNEQDTIFPEQRSLTPDAAQQISPHIASESTLPITARMSLGESDTDVLFDILPDDLERGVFEKLQKEVQWERMSHQGGEVPRLVAVQGEVSPNGSIPIYRHPADESPPLRPFTSTVLAIRTEVEKKLGHSINHVLIQHYRDGNDYISEHSDKTLDIVPGSFIANVSLGAQRTMVLRTKRSEKLSSEIRASAEPQPRQTQRAALPHNSLFRMGLQTNMKWLHAIRQDKRADRDKEEAELAFNSARISLTFRKIGTFLNQEETLIWGQGATSKTMETAMPVINGTGTEAIKMLRAFGTENHSSEFDWQAHYGCGFDVLHIRNSPRFFSSTDDIVNQRIKFMLAEYEITYATGNMSSLVTENKSGLPDSTSESVSTGHLSQTKFVDDNEQKTVVQGDLAIMLYLHQQHMTKHLPNTDYDMGLLFTLFQKGLAFLHSWRSDQTQQQTSSVFSKQFRKELEAWDTIASHSPYLAGESPGLPDFTVWPVLHAVVERHGQKELDAFSRISQYYNLVLQRDAMQRILSKRS